jgi:hypothetical protein
LTDPFSLKGAEPQAEAESLTEGPEDEYNFHHHASKARKIRGRKSPFVAFAVLL